MLKKLQYFYLWLTYKKAEYKRSNFSHKAIAQKQKKNGNVVILYTIFGKRDTYEIELKRLLEDKEILSRFSPLQTCNLGQIAMGEYLSSNESQEIQKKYQAIKHKILPTD